jgi:hypothetical protein
MLTGRTANAARQHHDYLVTRPPGIGASRRDWSEQEDRVLLDQYILLGSQWTDISQMLTGRTATAVRHRHAALVKKEDGGGSVLHLPQEPETTAAGVDDDADERQTQRRRVPQQLGAVGKAGTGTGTETEKGSGGLKKGWSEEEDRALLEAYALHGNESMTLALWTKVGRMVPRRNAQAAMQRHAVLVKEGRAILHLP